ncbi:MAG: guanylate kinase [Christensenellaceae bacterium]|nr:guanylate kinase [Christensenellaceae bacterium]
MNKKGLLLVLSGPSGVGKGTVAASLLDKHNDICFSVSATTRQIRPGEQEGVSYFYKSVEEFNSMIANNEFLEYMCVFGKNYYGTPRAYVENKLNQGMNVLLDIDVQGAMSVKANYPEAVMVFIAPPSLSVLRSRLVGRATETPEAVERRLAECKTELAYIPKYDYVVVNDDLNAAVEAIECILSSAKCASNRNNDLLQQLMNEEIEEMKPEVLS